MGAAQAMATGDTDLDDILDEQNSSMQYGNDTTAVSDRNSMQNFSYYGRRFMANSNKQEMSPVPRAEAVNAHPKLKNAVNVSTDSMGNPSRVLRQNSNNGAKNMEQASNHTMSEAVSHDGPFQKRGTQQYNLEEKMNQGLMKQFKGMFEDEEIP